MPSNLSGRYHLKEALTLSERKQFADALYHTDHALIAFAQDNDLAGYAETYSMKFHIFKHILSYTNFIGHRYSALTAALTGAEIAEQHNLPNAYVMLINAAKALDHDGQTEKAIEYYDKAIAAITSNPSARQAELADTQSHKDALLLAQGDTQAEERMLRNIEIVQNAQDISTYERDVWMSGAYLRLTKALLHTDKEKAIRYKDEAKKIIESNPELVIRKDQLTKIS